MAKGNEVNFRQAGEQDYAQICNLFCNEQELLFVFPTADYPFTATQLKMLIEKRYNSTVALIHNQVVGFANLYDLVPGEELYLGNVMVKAEFRKYGIGSSLVNYLLELANKEYRVKRIKLNCWAENIKALTFYQSLGFSVVGTLDKIIKGRTVEILTLEKQLALDI